MSRKYGGRHAAEPSHLGEANAAHTPSPVCLNNQPPVRFDRLAQHFVMGAERHPHPVGVGPPPTDNPEGAADTYAGSHNRYAPTSHIGGSGPRRRALGTAQSTTRRPDRSGDKAHVGLAGKR
jgi:hypothetical protein